jgi:hypothetical protein
MEAEREIEYDVDAVLVIGTSLSSDTSAKLVARLCKSAIVVNGPAVYVNLTAPSRAKISNYFTAFFQGTADTFAMSLATGLGLYTRLMYDQSLWNNHLKGANGENAIVRRVLEDPWWCSPVVRLCRVYSRDIQALCTGKKMSLRAMNAYIALLVSLNEQVECILCEVSVRVSKALWEGRHDDVWQSLPVRNAFSSSTQPPELNSLS